jgi:hypothetical protein
MIWSLTSVLRGYVLYLYNLNKNTSLGAHLLIFNSLEIRVDIIWDLNYPTPIVLICNTNKVHTTMRKPTAIGL